jgi:hypothetical protein
MERLLSRLPEDRRPLYDCFFEIRRLEGFRWKANPKGFSLYLDVQGTPIWMCGITKLGVRNGGRICLYLQRVEALVNEGESLTPEILAEFDGVGLFRLSVGSHGHNRVIDPGTIFDIEHLNRIDDAFSHAADIIRDYGLRA